MLVISAANISQMLMFSCDLRMRKKYDVFRKKKIYTRVFIGRRKMFLLISGDKRLCWDKL